MKKTIIIPLTKAVITYVFCLSLLLVSAAFADFGEYSSYRMVVDAR